MQRTNVFVALVLSCIYKVHRTEVLELVNYQDIRTAVRCTLIPFSYYFLQILRCDAPNHLGV